MSLHKLKSTASAAAVPQSALDAQRAITALGQVQRDLVRIEADINDAIAALNGQHAPRIEALRTKREALQAGIQTWCEANRAGLCGKGKSANLVTGEVAWRQRPPSVAVRNTDAVIDQLGQLGLTQFVRVKHEVNKEAVLAEPEAVRGIKGLQVNVGIEDFVITPFEVDLEQRA